MRQKTVREMKIRQIEKINKLLGSDVQLSPESFDVLWDLEIDELIDILFQLEREHKKGTKTIIQTH